MTILRWLLPISALAMLASACSASASNQPAAAAAPSPKPDQDAFNVTPAATTSAKPAAAVASPKPIQGGAEGKQWPNAPAMAIDQAKTYTATLKTEQGDIEIMLFPKEAPIAVNNFVFLARNGYYANVPIHRIVQGFVIQSGDPTGTGMGGPGYKIQDEPVKMNYSRGIVAMARTPAPNSAGSQFFICLQDIQLPKQYVIFGQVTKGMDAVDKIAQTPTKVGGGGEKSSPVTPVSIQDISIAES
jgi:cyclophilin family peptidyl-prolyl cis-trans isomerase